MRMRGGPGEVPDRGLAGRSSSACAAGRSGRRGSAAGGRGSGAETCGPRSSTCWPREQPWNGYQIIQEIGARTQGVWRPSAGSVYPALQQLEDEALIKAEAAGEDRRRMYTLTEEGQAYVTEHADELKASWDAVTGSVNDTEVQLRHTIHQVMVAVSQVAQAGLRGPGPAGWQDPG